MYSKLRMLVKPLEFALVIGIIVLGVIFGAFKLMWALGLAVVYVVMKLSGWGTKHVQHVIDETKDNVGDVKDKIEDFKNEVKEDFKK